MDFDSKAKSIKGLNIAIIILAGIGIVAVLGLIALFFCLVAGSSGSSSVSPYYSEGTGMGFLGSGGYSLTSAGYAVGIALLIFIVVCAICPFALILVAGIVALRRAHDPNRLGTAFAWSIVGIILAAVVLDLALLILLIISAVQINEARKIAAGRM